MANYFRTDTSFMKNTNSGGRLHSAKYGTEIPNGFIGFLGGYISGSTEIRTLLAPTVDLLKGKNPVIVMKPEINYKQDKMTDYAIGIFRNPANKAVPTIPFVFDDGIDLSEDYFDKTGKANGKIEVNDIYVLQANGNVGKQLKYSATAPEAVTNGFYFKVIGVKRSHTAIYVHSDGSRFPVPYQMVQLEIVFN